VVKTIKEKSNLQVRQMSDVDAICQCELHRFKYISIYRQLPITTHMTIRVSGAELEVLGCTSPVMKTAGWAKK